MTAVEAVPVVAEVSTTAPAPSAAKPVAPKPKPNLALRRVGAILCVGALFVIGFVVYLFGLSSVSESRVQTTMYRNFAAQLGAAVAPVQAPIAEGTPVAILDIPRLGMHDVVVVEGSTARDLTKGPGHVRASALPGQAGVSFIYGKVATFGAPFAHLMRLNRGDHITVTTGQGVATYVVASFGTSRNPAPDPTTNRLVLVTAGSSFIPTTAVQVDADLVSAPQTNPGGQPVPGPAERDMASDFDSLIPLMLWSQALLLASIGGSVLAARWARWPAYLTTAPVVIALAWCVYENLAGLLPNLY